MPKFFKEGFGTEDPFITGPDADHIVRSLRMGPGEELTVSDLCGKRYDCVIESAQPGRVGLRIVSAGAELAEPKTRVTLFQCLPKGDKLETVVQKAVELGVDSVTQVISSRCISRPDPKSAQKKTERLCRIAREAAVQSGRGCIPRVLPPVSFDEALKQFPGFDSVLFFYEGGGGSVGELLRGGRVALVIGPEGGFSADEVERAKAAGAKVASLGPRILRTETAPIAALAAVMYLSGELQ